MRWLTTTFRPQAALGLIGGQPPWPAALENLLSRQHEIAAYELIAT